MTVDLELITCDHCQKPFPADGGQDICADTGLWCDNCAEEWKAHFKACEHAWEPHEGEWGPGRYCPKCAGFIED